MRRVDVTADTDEWLAERRRYVMASDAPAVMGLSSWQTPLDVWHAKNGQEQPFPEMLGWLGHRMEPVIADWLRRFHPELGQIRRGFMAVSEEWPWLGATLDRVQQRTGNPIELKTANRHVIRKWLGEGGDVVVPTDYRVQVQTQLAVTGRSRAFVAVALGGSDFELVEEPRDDEFIRDHLVPRTREFWELVRDGVMPPPATLAEQAQTWPTEKGKTVEASATAVEMAERWAVLRSDLAAQEAEADALKKALGEYMGDANVLTVNGEPVVRLRTQQGRKTVSVADLEAADPELASELVKQSAPFKVMTWARKDKK